MRARIVNGAPHHLRSRVTGRAALAGIPATQPEHPGLAAQRAYAGRMQAAGFGFELTVAEAFVRGIRDIGYRSTGTALDELVDNSIQADARTVIVAFGSSGSEKKPDTIAVIDDGHGMAADMVRLAGVWGGTHREGNRCGFGRYGYGLPSACVSQGRRFTIYSRPCRGLLHAITLDVDEIAAGLYRDGLGRVVVPAAEPAKLPGWVRPYVTARLPGGRLEHGTVIVVEKLDRLSRTTVAGLRRHLVDHFGLVYRNALGRVDLWVDDEVVEPIDPLFLTPDARFFDLDDDRAEPLDQVDIQVSGPATDRTVDKISVRYAFFPATFASIDKQRAAWGRNANARFPILRDHNGIVCLRMGRQIDVVTRGPWAPFQNNDRYWKVELDFPASLDEEFGITTSKQRVEVSSRIWQILEEAGVGKAVEQLRRMNAKARAWPKDVAQGYGEWRSSTLAMVRSRRVSRAGEIDNSADDKLGRRYAVRIEAAPGRPFFWIDCVDSENTLVLNSAHRFFTDIYASPHAVDDLRGMLEVLLFTFGENELDRLGGADGVRRLESPGWSARLAAALDVFSQAGARLGGRYGRDEDESAAGAIRCIGETYSGAGFHG